MEDQTVMDHNNKVLKTLKEGDLIEFQSEKDGNIFSHWAVYIGTGKKRVIHLKGIENADDSSEHVITVNGERFKRVRVMHDSFRDVAKDSKAIKNNDEDEQMTPYDPKEILRRAFDRIGDRYDHEMLSDCKDFALYCRYNISQLAEAIEKQNRIVLETLEDGDLVEFRRGSHTHLAIYVGEMRVIHLKGIENADDNTKHWITVNGERFKSVCVIQDYFWNVVNDSKVCKSNEKTQYKPKEILRRAFDRIGTIYDNEMLSDCKDFALYCRYNRSMLAQVIQRKNETVLWSLGYGDLVEFRRGLHIHWAIYAGNQTVVHFVHEGNDNTFSDTRIKKGSVQQDDFWKIAYDFEVYKNDDKYKHPKAHLRQETAKKAREKIGETTYSNSEQFVNSCIYKRSRQNVSSRNDAVLDSLVSGDLVEFRKEYCSHWAVVYHIYKGGNEEKRAVIVHLEGEDEVDDDKIAGNKTLFKISGRYFRRAKAVRHEFSAVAVDSVAMKNNKLDVIMQKDGPQNIRDRLESSMKRGSVNFDSRWKTCERFATFCRYGANECLKVKQNLRSNNKSVLDSLKNGDLVEFCRGKYYHTAVYVGNKEVVYIAGQEYESEHGIFRSKASLPRQTTEKVLIKKEKIRHADHGCKIRKINDKYKKTLIAFDPEETIKRANYMLGMKYIDDIWATPERFAVLCRYGTQSDQIRLQNNPVLEKLKEGHLIELKRERHTHWGVYVGNNIVVHLNDNYDGNVVYRKGFILQNRVWDLAQNSQISKNEEKDRDMTAYDPVEITSRANAEIGKPIRDRWKKCEDFATYSRYGTADEQIRVHNRGILQKIQLGDILKVIRTGYYHCAVYVGNEEVVHYASVPNTTKAVVKCERFWEVAKDTKVYIYNMKDTEINPYEPEEIEKRARSEIGRVDYHVLLQNCEHLATRCRYGKPMSDQVKRCVIFVSAIIVLCAGAYLLKRKFKQM